MSTLFKVKAGIDVVFIPYKGAAASITDMLGGRTQYTIDGLVSLYPLIKDGKLRALGIARGERWPALPDVPTLPESGFPDFVIDAWTGVVAPAGTPPDIVAKLNRAINDGLKSPEMKTGLERFSAIAKPGSPQDFTAFMQSELPKWAGLVKLSGAKKPPFANSRVSPAGVTGHCTGSSALNASSVKSVRPPRSKSRVPSFSKRDRPACSRNTSAADR